MVYENLANLIVRLSTAQLASCKLARPDTGGIDFIIQTRTGYESFGCGHFFLKAFASSGYISSLHYPDNGVALRDKNKAVKVAENVTCAAPRGSDDVIIHFKKPPDIKDMAEAFAGALRNSIAGRLPGDMKKSEVEPLVQTTMKTLGEGLRAVVAKGRVPLAPSLQPVDYFNYFFI